MLIYLSYDEVNVLCQGFYTHTLREFFKLYNATKYFFLLSVQGTTSLTRQTGVIMFYYLWLYLSTPQTPNFQR